MSQSVLCSCKTYNVCLANQSSFNACPWPLFIGIQLLGYLRQHRINPLVFTDQSATQPADEHSDCTEVLLMMVPRGEITFSHWLIPMNMHCPTLLGPALHQLLKAASFQIFCHPKAVLPGVFSFVLAMHWSCLQQFCKSMLHLLQQGARPCQMHASCALSNDRNTC